jgi:hypothetical protein
MTQSERETHRTIDSTMIASAMLAAIMIKGTAGGPEDDYAQPV